MKTIQQKQPESKLLVMLFIVIVFIVLIAGHLFFKYKRRSLINEKQIELSVICDLKIRQITQWRLERLSGGEFLADNILMANKLTEFILNPGEKSMREDILKTLGSLVNNYDYRSVMLIDTSGSVRLSIPESDTLIGYHLRSLIPDVIKTRKLVLTDLHRADPVSYVHLDLLIPLIYKRQNDTVVLGILALRIDPEKALFPMIQSWPVQSKSSESLLIRREGDEVVYLNTIKHVNNPELELRNPQNKDNLAAVMAVQGISTTAEAIDYRGVPVFAAMRKVPGTEWYMVAKTDKKEVLDGFYSGMVLVIIILVLIVSSVGLLLGYLIRNRRVKYYREKYESELDRLALIKHFGYILKFANDIILLINSDLRIVEANDRALEIYNYSRDEFIGKQLKDIRAPETLSNIDQNLQTVRENESATFETVHQRKNGSTFPVEISSRLLRIEGAEYYQTIGRDITGRKNDEIILKESEEKFRKIFEESPFSIAMTGKDYGIVRANLSFCNMIGYDEEELRTLSFRDFTHPEYIGKDELSLMRLVAKEIPVYRAEKQYIRKDGSVIWGSTNISIIRNNKGEVQYFLAMLEDITSRKKSELELILAKEKAEESDRLKTAFLHNVSHEIRTPMNAIIGFSSLLNEPGLSDAERNQYGDIIFQSSNQLLSVINDIVDIANVESGQVKLNSRIMNLNSGLRSLNEQFMLRGKDNNVTLSLTTGLKDEESEIVTDSTKVIQILSNLLNNSYKFTKKGSIDFGYVLNGDFLEFTVKDTGIGIPSDHIERIFDRFYQVDSAGSRQFGGTGLGLSICKAYVELMGGEINVLSVAGEGTRFTFTIPYLKDKG